MFLCTSRRLAFGQLHRPKPGAVFSFARKYASPAVYTHLILLRLTPSLREAGQFEPYPSDQITQREHWTETMNNSDLIAYLKPIASQFSQPGAVELIDMTGRVTDIQADRYRLMIRLELSAGLYRGRFDTVAHAFDMASAMIEMVQVPDGKRVPVGPWDLDHIRNVMAMPMMRAYVNGKLKGGLWFSMPGPREIAEGRLFAEFGFAAVSGTNELVLEFLERDRARMDWGRLSHMELRKDDRTPLVLKPKDTGHPRIFLGPDDAARVRERWQATSEFEAIRKQLLTEDLVYLTDNSQGTLELACLYYAVTGDAAIGMRAKDCMLELAHAPTWSGRPDPLLMGGDNDRGISLRLYMTALGWDYLQPLLAEADRHAMLMRAGEYIGKMYDFTLLQRGYMGCPAIDPHSLGAWNGTAIACMAFYEELAIARKALPLFHGLFTESLGLFPASGKAPWATYFPFHLVLYLAAAQTFAGRRRELETSAFLDHLGDALLASFDVPNSQEMQRGLRTREHRFLTAFLCHFHPTPGIEDTYRAFAGRELKATGSLVLGTFDLLYAPPSADASAAFLDRPLFANDVGDLILTVHGEHTVVVSISGRPKVGMQAVFHLMPQNREFAPSIGAFDVSVDGTPVLCNINMGQYGLNSALTNTMCFEDGGVITNGQYLNGAVPPDASGVIRRCFIDERYVYMHIVITHALDPLLSVRHADRVFIVDRKTGTILVSDGFSGDRTVRFATHLHSSGSVTELSEVSYRLSGGQANLMAGMKGGNKGLDDAERGELFVQVLKTSSSARVVIEEPTWVPGYIYGLNNTGKEDMSEGRFPRYRRWRLAADEAVTHGSFLLALGLHPDAAQLVEDVIRFREGGHVRFGYAKVAALGVECLCECLLWDQTTHRMMAMGVRRMQHGPAVMDFSFPVDMTYSCDNEEGVLYTQSVPACELMEEFKLDPWVPIGEEGWKTLNTHRAVFRKAGMKTSNTEKEA